MSDQPKKLNPVWKAAKPFINGGLSGMAATCVIQPIDMVKVRLQLGETGGPIAVASRMIKNEGFLSMYKGLDAGLVRQATYTTSRLGIFQTLNSKALEMNNNQPLPLSVKALLGLTAGGLGALVGTPADLTLIRMQADTTLPPEQRRNYKGVFDAFMRITKEEGFTGLFRGSGPTIVRAMALNMGMLASNEQFKELIQGMGFAKGSNPVVLGAATLAGIVSATCSLPFDFVKTRIQKMQPLPDGTMPYKGFVDCAVQTLRKEGPLVFYTGYPTYCVRIAPHVTATLIFVAWLPRLQAKVGL
eukprot:TRINITY_DN37953_c0_g1_i1.p2 TRINITY_DN37953_c0_g1~~TRINITY_DN37953_c0_g1_i1.p2  ORF type:complete len:301 (-),score=41.56 TRINITY_DN37953_c0_g1_i1:775-1677(-)